MEIGIYITANVISSSRAIFGRLCRLFLAAIVFAYSSHTQLEFLWEWPRHHVAIMQEVRLSRRGWGLSPAPAQCRNWHGLHQSGYCHHMMYVYVGTRNLN